MSTNMFVFAVFGLLLVTTGMIAFATNFIRSYLTFDMDEAIFSLLLAIIFMLFDTLLIYAFVYGLLTKGLTF